MADTIWVQIIKNRKAAIDAAKTGLLTVRLQDFSAVDPPKVQTPAAWIWGGPETKLTESGSYESWKRQLCIEVWGKGLDMEDLLGKIHKALYADRQCESLAIDMVRTSVEVQAVDPSRSIGGMLIMYDVQYRHKVGDPYSQ